MSRHNRHWLLRRTDQSAATALTLAAAVAMVGWWSVQRGPEDSLSEIDRAAPLCARFEVDLNTADWPELVQLPGVGEALALRIVASRETSGPFTCPDDLPRVHGIGLKKLERIRPYVKQ